MRRPSKSMLAATALVLTACVPQAGASPTGSIAPNPVPIPAPTTGSYVKADAAVVTWAGLASDPPLRFLVCGWNAGGGADEDTETSCVEVPATQNGAPGSPAGTASISLFRGIAPSDGGSDENEDRGRPRSDQDDDDNDQDDDDGASRWGCFADQDIAPPGVEKRTTCYVRIVSGDDSRAGKSLSIPFTIADEIVAPDPVIPDLPGGPLLTIGASAVAVAVISRTRRRTVPS